MLPRVWRPAEKDGLLAPCSLLCDGEREGPALDALFAKRGGGLLSSGPTAAPTPSRARPCSFGAVAPSHSSFFTTMAHVWSDTALSLLLRAQREGQPRWLAYNNCLSRPHRPLTSSCRSCARWICAACNLFEQIALWPRDSSRPQS